MHRQLNLSIPARAFRFIGPPLLASAAALCTAQDYPSKAGRIVVGYPAGGANDILARMVAQKFSESWAQQFIVDNRPGANGIIGTELVARAPPDGYTLGIASLSPLVFSRFTYAKVPYDSLADFTPLTTLAMTPMMIAVHPSMPATNIKALVALAQAQPGVLTFATSGSGGMTYMVLELFRSATGTRLQMVPYKGAAPALTDTVAGHVQGIAEALPTLQGAIKQGRLRGIAITSEQRNKLLPDVPTAAEQGLRELVAVNWFGLVAPARTPRSVVEKLHGALIKISMQSDVRERFASMGLEPMTMASPEAFGAFVKVEIARWGKVAHNAGIKPQ